VIRLPQLQQPHVAVLAMLFVTMLQPELLLAVVVLVPSVSPTYLLVPHLLGQWTGTVSILTNLLWGNHVLTKSGHVTLV